MQGVGDRWARKCMRGKPTATPLLVTRAEPAATRLSPAAFCEEGQGTDGEGGETLQTMPAVPEETDLEMNMYAQMRMSVQTQCKGVSACVVPSLRVHDRSIVSAVPAARHSPP